MHGHYLWTEIIGHRIVTALLLCRASDEQTDETYRALRLAYGGAVNGLCY